MKFYKDPLLEKKFTKLKGLVYKYSGRVLIEMNNICPVFCDFCTRRIFSCKKNWQLERREIENILDFLKLNLEIDEVIISGGDPLVSVDKLCFFLKEIEKMKSIKIIRIHTRMPITAPEKIDENIFDFLKKYKKIIYLSIHCNLAEELNEKNIAILDKFRKSGVILYSQTVFLKGINDSTEKLEKLFKKLLDVGVRPYYIYRCDPAVGLSKFIVPLAKEKEIMTELRRKISGLACPTYVIDSPQGFGKIPVPLNFWKSEKEFFDFNKNLIEIDE